MVTRDQVWAKVGSNVARREKILNLDFQSNANRLKFDFSRDFNSYWMSQSDKSRFWNLVQNGVI